MGVSAPWAAVVTASMGTARFRFCPSSKPAAVMPMTSPYLLTSAPPLLPWEMGALIWM